MRAGLLLRLVVVVSIAIVPALLVQGYMQWQLHRAMVGGVEAEAIRLVDLVASEQRRIAEGVQQTLAAIVSNEAVQAGDVAGCQAFVNRTDHLLPNWQDIRITDRDGTIICSSDPGSLGVNVRYRNHIAQAFANGGFAVGNHIITQSTHEHVLPYAMAYRDAAGDVAGVATITVEVDWLGRFLTDHSFPDNTSVTVADGKGTILVRVPNMANVEGKPMPAAYLELLNHDTKGVAYMEGFDGINRVVAYSPPRSNNLNLYFSVALDARSSLTPITRAAIQGWCYMALAALAALAAALLFHRLWLRRPFDEMLTVAQAWKSGDTTARLPPNPHLPELGAVAMAFNQVAEAAADRERARRIAEKANENLRHMAAANIIGVARHDEDGSISEANDYYLNLLGYSRSEFEAGIVRWSQLTPPEYWAADQRAWAELRERGICTPFDKQYIRRDGTRVWAHVGAVSLEGTRAALAFIFDIDGAKNAEQAALEAREEADRANLAKSKFLAAASHDLRQPVQSLMLFTSALSAQLTDHPSHPLVEHITSSVGALQTMLNSMLDISRLDAAVIDPRPTDFQLSELLDRLGAEYAPRAGKKGVGLDVVPAKVVVNTDPGLLERILRNLLENALRYTRNGRILVGCRRKRGAIRIDVVDTGIGIPAKHRRAIFEEFYQVGNPARDRSLGLGLGLSIVKRLSGLLGLKVSVASQEGRGSCFSVTIPLAAHQNVMAAPAKADCPQQLNGLVLVVDDDPLVREALSWQLQGWGAEVIAAESAAEALGKLTSARTIPDVIIADYRLAGGRTGVEAIDEIEKKIGRPQSTFILTGDTAPDRIAEVRKSGHRLLHKPISAEVLKRALLPVMDAAE